ncbi:MAG: AraC family transcriptional regulator ligand-binding domain-containing protein [Shimia thalassica]|uniref:helix-turn-helix domain-containing protein n=1 Tax=Shimia thalassica TaxID=1715693 RepID=UPI00329738F8
MQVDRSRVDYLADQISRALDKSTADELLKHAGLNDRRQEIDAIQEAQLLEAACERLDDLLFGVRTGLGFRQSTTLTGYVARHSKTLASAIRNSRKVNRAVFPAYDFSLNVSSNAATFRFQAIDERLLKFHRHRELLGFGVLSFLREISGSSFYPYEVRFSHHVGARADQIQKLAGFPVVFGAEEMELVLPLSVLELPIPTYEPKLRDYLVAYGERLLADMPDPNPSLRARIEGILTGALPDRLVAADEVASSLGMSSRTMARRLKEDGLTFREIVDDLRLSLAKSYLESGMSVTEIGFLLDYSDTASFSTAFKRWTGQSPRAYSNAHS